MDVDSVDTAYDGAAGLAADLKIEVTDSLGNTSEMTLTGITLDGNNPGISNLFPTGKDGPDDPPTAPKNADRDDEPTINLTHQESGLPDQRRTGFAVHSLS